MNLIFGKTYILYTNGRTINGLKVTIKGIVDYVNAKRIPYQLSALAINEAVVSTDANDATIATYFQDKMFYICQAENAALYLVWSDIIDSAATISAIHVTKAILQLTIENDVGVTDSAINTALLNFLTTTYLGKVTGQLSVGTTVEVAKSYEDVYKDLLDSSKGVLEAFRGLQTLIPFLNKIDALDLDPKLAGIQTSIETIRTSVAKIASVIK